VVTCLVINSRHLRRQYLDLLRSIASFVRFTNFQSLTNCPRFATHSEPLCFQPITNWPVCKSFVLTTIQQCRGCVGASLRAFKPFNLLTSKQLPCNSIPLPSSPLFSKAYALFSATAAAQLFWSQLFAHSFYRHGGVGGPFHSKPLKKDSEVPTFPGFEEFLALNACGCGRRASRRHRIGHTVFHS
jgi:hypothetical protein